MSASGQWWPLCGVRRGMAFVREARHCRVQGGGGGADHEDPHTDIPLHCAHTMEEVAIPPVCGGGTTDSVREATCAMGVAPVLGQRDQGGGG